MYRAYINQDGLRIILPESIWMEIKAIVAKFYPNECGGIFTGRIDIQNNTATVEQIIVPEKIKSTPVFFRRLAKGINDVLSQLFVKTKGESYYLGEWHSHPNARPYPSDTDFSTMQKIADNANIAIKTPVLLIVGYDGHSFSERFFILFNNRLISYERQ